MGKDIGMIEINILAETQSLKTQETIFLGCNMTKKGKKT